MRASVTSSLSFANCRIPASAELPGAQGLRAALSCLTQARYGIGWGVLGAAMDCYETARSYTVLRKQFDDRPIASHQLVQEKLADMITEITKAALESQFKDMDEDAVMAMVTEEIHAMRAEKRAAAERRAG